MAIKVPIGNVGFKNIRQKGSYYVEKTRLLVELLCNDDMVTLITRPRRFGKSLMLSTLEEFFNICNNKEDTRTLRRAGSHGAGRPRGAIHVQVSSAAFFLQWRQRGYVFKADQLHSDVYEELVHRQWANTRLQQM